MSVTELCKRIAAAEEFVVDKESLLGLDKVAIGSASDYKTVAESLVYAYWGLPKREQQEEWIEIVLEQIGQREDGWVFIKAWLASIREKWSKIGIRREKKFELLVKQVVAWSCKQYTIDLEEWVVRGPGSKYDVAAMGTVLASKSVLNDKEVVYLVNYFIAQGDTYFREFFRAKVLPVLKKQGIDQTVAELAYEAGNNPKASLRMRELLHKVYLCGRESGKD
ncbi:hypothetical protein NEHOM01_0877 [Nematocida homosporus]|uniref:uncharacterized protein n=1 Tax=Nematocida homosporus TaxID=1912981 RepID=UPI00221EF9EB|nr:uncharacterized protein NEHOM01_0877 [Nematocida homosporus]KAI5185518.1 hypothetical protein NEHOM01_0877 [Nematocida homosporus]